MKDDEEMTNLEINMRIALAMGYNDVQVHGGYVYYRDEKEDAIYKFNPTESISDTWKVAEWIGFVKLYFGCDGLYHVYLDIENLEYAEAETAQRAICLSAMKVINRERDQLNEKI